MRVDNKSVRLLKVPNRFLSVLLSPRVPLLTQLIVSRMFPFKSNLSKKNNRKNSTRCMPWFSMKKQLMLVWWATYAKCFRQNPHTKSYFITALFVVTTWEDSYLLHVSSTAVHLSPLPPSLSAGFATVFNLSNPRPSFKSA